MSVLPSVGSTSPTNLPDKPVGGILGTAVEGRGNPGGFGNPNPFDVRLTEAIAQARTLAKMGMKDQRTSSPGSLLRSQASRWKGFQLVCKLQALDHYPHHSNAH